MSLRAELETARATPRAGRAKLEQKLEQKLDQKLEQKLDQKLDQKLAQYATKADLERFATKADLERFATKADLERFATKADLAELAARVRVDLELWGGAIIDRLSKEIAGAAKAAQEAHQSEISVIDDKYADLPGRVSKLEARLRKPR